MSIRNYCCPFLLYAVVGIVADEKNVKDDDKDDNGGDGDGGKGAGEGLNC